MKRNMELVRSILLEMEKQESGFVKGGLEVDGFDDEAIGYHCYLMAQAGLINAAESTSMSSSSPSAIPTSLTWEGHEFLDNIKCDNVWGEAKRLVGIMGEASFSVWTSVVTKIVMQNLNLDC
jgi:hypothetical protein